MKFSYLTFILFGLLLFKEISTLRRSTKTSSLRQDESGPEAEEASLSTSDSTTAEESSTNEQEHSNLETTEEPIQQHNDIVEQIESVKTVETTGFIDAYNPIYYEGGSFGSINAAVNSLIGIELTSLNAVGLYMPFLILSDIVECSNCYLYQWNPWFEPGYVVVAQGPVPRCQVYSSTNPVLCEFCAHSYFLFNNTCLESCPDNFNANMATGRCDAVREDNSPYTKAFTLDSCLNQCGKQLKSCSCCPEAAANGQLCSDYYSADFGCDASFEHTLLLGLNDPSNSCQNTVDGCILCNDRNQCVQCDEGKLLLIDGNSDEDVSTSCVSSCPETHRLLDNNVCKPKNGCEAANCDQCAEDSSSICAVCDIGYFLDESANKCVKRCVGKVADRLSGKCVSLPSCDNRLTIYRDLNSQFTCSENKETVGDASGCSCAENLCYEYGNCCADVTNVCPFTSETLEDSTKDIDSIDAKKRKNLNKNKKKNLKQRNNAKNIYIKEVSRKDILEKLRATIKRIVGNKKISKKNVAKGKNNKDVKKVENIKNKVTSKSLTKPETKKTTVVNKGKTATTTINTSVKQNTPKNNNSKTTQKTPATKK